MDPVSGSVGKPYSKPLESTATESTRKNILQITGLEKWIQNMSKTQEPEVFTALLHKFGKWSIY